MRMLVLTGLFGCLLCPSPSQADDAAAKSPEKGTVHYQPIGDQKDVPERYRLTEHTFDYEMTPKTKLPGGGVEIYHVRYPSPVVSAHPENNTVYSEYYRPAGPGLFPGVIVLDITGGNQMLS